MGQICGIWRCTWDYLNFCYENLVEKKNFFFAVDKLIVHMCYITIFRTGSFFNWKVFIVVEVKDLFGGIEGCLDFWFFCIPGGRRLSGWLKDVEIIFIVAVGVIIYALLFVKLLNVLRGLRSSTLSKKLKVH